VDDRLRRQRETAGGELVDRRVGLAHAGGGGVDDDLERSEVAVGEECGHVAVRVRHDAETVALGQPGEERTVAIPGGVGVGDEGLDEPARRIGMDAAWLARPDAVMPDAPGGVIRLGSLLELREHLA